MKRVLSLLLAFVLCLSLLPLAVLASEEAAADPVIGAEEAPALDGETYSGKCGDDVYWSLDTLTGVITISGTGYMDGYESYKDEPWYPYVDSIKSAVI